MPITFQVFHFQCPVERSTYGKTNELQGPNIDPITVMIPKIPTFCVSSSAS